MPARFQELIKITLVILNLELSWFQWLSVNFIINITVSWQTSSSCREDNLSNPFLLLHVVVMKTDQKLARNEKCQVTFFLLVSTQFPSSSMPSFFTLLWAPSNAKLFLPLMNLLPFVSSELNHVMSVKRWETKEMEKNGEKERKWKKRRWQKQEEKNQPSRKIQSRWFHLETITCQCKAMQLLKIKKIRAWHKNALKCKVKD